MARNDGRIGVSFRVSAETAKRWQAFCRQSGRLFRDLGEDALNFYMNQSRFPSEGREEAPDPTVDPEVLKAARSAAEEEDIF